MPNKAIDADELKHNLLNAGFTTEQVEKLGKRELKAEWDKIQFASKILDSVEITQSDKILKILPGDNMTFSPEVDSTPVEVSPSLSPTDPEWTDYVMGQFKDNELDNGAPKADALRRVAEKLLGIFDIHTDVVQVPDLEGRATVVVTLQFHSPRRTVSGAADVSSVNTAKDFAIHPVATAETRAEGRALRKALRLNKVLTAEELKGAEPDEPNGLDSRAPTSMLNSLKLMCDRQKIDLGRLVKTKLNVENIQDLTLSQGRSLSTQLFEYGRKPEEIPDEVKTF